MGLPICSRESEGICCLSWILISRMRWMMISVVRFRPCFNVLFVSNCTVNQGHYTVSPGKVASTGLRLLKFDS